MNNLSECTANNKDLRINGTVQKICDVLLPFVRHGSTQGVLRIGYVKKIIQPPIGHLEIITHEAIRRAYYVLYIFIALAIVLIWGVSLFLENQARIINLEQQKTNRRQLEVIGAGIVHEVKNALNGIRMNIQMLQDKFEKLPPELKESFSKNAERIQREAGRTSDMLSEFLTYAKPGRFNPSPTNILALLHEIAQSFESEYKKRNIDFICECSSEMTSIIADSRQLRHGITNLLWNSLEAVDKDGKIILKGELSNGKAKISVEDDGGGMDTKTEKKSFEVFYSTKSQGSGLGLSIVKKVALSHSGKVTINNYRGKGCKFTIIFPVTNHE
ncbi:HAMP domain-containing histidine kinase [bacterium]|nr:HAMP domain-containing histidine kinase [bacterium]